MGAETKTSRAAEGPLPAHRSATTSIDIAAPIEIPRARVADVRQTAAAERVRTVDVIVRTAAKIEAAAVRKFDGVQLDHVPVGAATEGQDFDSDGGRHRAARPGDQVAADPVAGRLDVHGSLETVEDVIEHQTAVCQDLHGRG